MAWRCQIAGVSGGELWVSRGAQHRLAAGNDEGRTGRPGACPAAAGPSARAAVPAFCEGGAGRTRACSGRGASGEDAAVASAFGLRLTQRAEESACRTGSPMRHDVSCSCHVWLSRSARERRRRRRRPRRLPSRIPCARTRAFPSQNAQGGQDEACRCPQPHGAAASRNSRHRGHPRVNATWGSVRGDQAARSPHGRRRRGAWGRGGRSSFRGNTSLKCSPAARRRGRGSGWARSIIADLFRSAIILTAQPTKP